MAPPSYTSSDGTCPQQRGIQHCSRLDACRFSFFQFNSHLEYSLLCMPNPIFRVGKMLVRLFGLPFGLLSLFAVSGLIPYFLDVRM